GRRPPRGGGDPAGLPRRAGAEGVAAGMRGALDSPLRRAALVVGLTVGGFFLVVGWLVWQALRYPERPGPPGGPGEVKVIVGKGMSLSDIARLLGEKQVVSHPEWFRFYANERGAT